MLIEDSVEERRMRKKKEKQNVYPSNCNMVSLQLFYYSIDSKLNTWYFIIQYSRSGPPDNLDLSLIFMSSYVLPGIWSLQ
jgi:hypothetical protein